MFSDTYFNKLYADFGQLRCKRAMQAHAAYIIQQAIDACIEQTFDFDDKKLLLFSHHFVSEVCSLDVEQDSIVVRTKSQITLGPTDILQVDLILHTNTAIELPLCDHLPKNIYATFQNISTLPNAMYTTHFRVGYFKS